MINSKPTSGTVVKKLFSGIGNLIGNITDNVQKTATDVVSDGSDIAVDTIPEVSAAGYQIGSDLVRGTIDKGKRTITQMRERNVQAMKDAESIKKATGEIYETAKQTSAQVLDKSGSIIRSAHTVIKEETEKLYKTVSGKVRKNKKSQPPVKSSKRSTKPATPPDNADRTLVAVNS